MFMCYVSCRCRVLSNGGGWCYRNWRQFRMLLWKNWLLQKKQPIRTILIVLYPIFISAFLVVLREIAKPAFRETPRTFGSFSVFEKSFTGQILQKNKVIVCVPDTTLVARFLNRAATIIGLKLPKSAS